MAKGKIFLTTEWTHLAMLNYVVDPAILQPHVPAGTELDTFAGDTFVSMVGFRFQNARVFGVSMPFHRNFIEVNLRFYVRRQTPAGWRRGVVFLKEIVALPAVAWTARWLYDENFCVLPTRYSLDWGADDPRQVRSASYQWKFAGEWQRLAVQTVGELQPTIPESEEQFIAEHYWGYTRRPDGSTSEYHVEHPPWQIWQVSAAEFECDIARLYGPEFVEPLSVAPHSAFLAAGSQVTVRRGQRIVSVATD